MRSSRRGLGSDRIERSEVLPLLESPCMREPEASVSPVKVERWLLV